MPPALTPKAPALTLKAPALTLKAPAKINWSLFVLGRRPDGYHDIRSLMQRIGLYDTLTFSESAAAGALTLAADMDLPPEQNLVYRAALLLREQAGIREGAAITLTKEIPSGAGLGGGSSDAAATLTGLNLFWGLGLSATELKELGGRLGSDVPFFFDGPLALAEGRGELLTPLPIERSRTLLVVKPAVSIETAWAYRELSTTSAFGDLTKGAATVNNIQLIYEALKAGDSGRLAGLLRNDFETVVFNRYSVVGELRQALRDRGAAAALMSGSGSAVFGLFEDRQSAERAAGHFSGHFCRVVETLTA